MPVTIETSLDYILSQDGTITGLIDDRVYPLRIPIDSDLPAVAYQTISDTPIMAHDGPTGTRRARLQITSTAESYAEAKAVSNAIDDLLCGYQAAAVVDESFEIESGEIENKMDGENQTTNTKTVRLDWIVYYINELAGD